MKRIYILAILVFVDLELYSQVEIIDTFKSVLSKSSSDTAKIDNLNSYIFQYSPNHPEVILKYSDTAIELSSKIHDSIRLALSYNRKGLIYYYLGDYNNSLENYFNALSIKEKRGDKLSTWREFNNIGLVLRNTEQNREALRYFRMVLQSIAIAENNQYKAIALNNIGVCYIGLDMLDSAKYMMEKALDLNTKLNLKQNRAYNLNNLGLIDTKKKNFKEAESYFLEALEINRQLYNSYEEAENLNNLTELYVNIKDFEKAKDCLKKAMSVLYLVHADQLKLQHLSITISYYTAINDYKTATEIWGLYAKLRDSLFYANKTKQFNQLKTLANAEKELQKVDYLEKINHIQNEKIRIQRIIQFGGIIAFSIILVLLIIATRSLRIIRKLNFSLKERTEELETLNEELHSSNEELLAQREEIELTLKTLKEAQKQIIQSEKMTSLGILAAGVSHEINNPLNFIQGGVNGLREYLKDPKSNESNIEFCFHAIDEGSEKAVSIVSGLNHFSRNEDHINRNIDVHNIINTCLLMLENKIKDRIRVKTSYTNEKFTLIGNDGKLHQAIMNILLNSVQAIKDQGEISISSNIMDSKLVLTIADSGCGISKEYLSRIFDPFFTTKEPGEGTGLGLSITYNIITEHKGTIEINSTQGKGTITTIMIPINQEYGD